MSRVVERRRWVSVAEQRGSYTLLSHGRPCDGFWSRLVGLMGKRSLGAGEGVLIYPCSSVHTWFMRLPIDVVYVSRHDELVAIDRGLRPWRFGKLHRGVRYVVETPAGTAARVQVGDRLVLTGWEPRTIWRRLQQAFGGR